MAPYNSRVFRVREFFLRFAFLLLFVSSNAWAGFSLGTGATYLRYKEDPGSVGLSELAWTIKLSSRHNLVGKGIEFHTNIYANAVPYQLSGKENPPARFYGANARFAMGGDWGKLAQVRLSLGGYVWGMYVEKNAYGLRYLVAPQAVLSIERSSLLRGRTWLIYGKYAPIKKRISYEIAAGIGFQLNSGSSARVVMLNLDVSKTRISQFSFAGTENGMTLHTASLGISFSLGSNKSSRGSRSARN